MERVAFDDVENRVQPAAVRKSLTDALGCRDLAVNYYELAPGDSFAFAYHSHDDQEEVFVVLEGTVTFETGSRDGDVAVGPNEAIRFAPGERQRGWNRGDERVRALGLGAPRSTGGGEKFADCPECGERTTHDVVRPDDEPDAKAVVCEACGRETGRWRGGADGENEWA